MSTSRFSRFSLAVIGATLAVIVWGAFVRASGSGAGCGNHWPLCNGEVLPRERSVETLIELTHRVTSGLAFVFVVIQYLWARRVFARGQGARRAAGTSLVFMITEALVGGGLVLFEMVAGNKSVARAWWMTGHLLNTFALVASLTVTWWLSRERPTLALPRNRYRLALDLGLGGVALVAVSGAIAALGDTLFPSSSLGAGLQDDFTATAHAFVRLRLWHPFLAVGFGSYLLALAARLAMREGFEALRGTATALAALVLVQLSLGLVNLLLLAPIALQLVHLLVADLLWMTLVVLRTRLAQAAEAPAHRATLADRAAPAVG